MTKSYILGEISLIMKYARGVTVVRALTVTTKPISKTQAPRWEYPLAGGGKREPS